MRRAKAFTVLGIETSTAVASIGIVREGRVLAERSEHHPGGHAESLPRLVHDVMSAAQIEVGELDGVAVAVGPGSFTGLRVGIAFAKGMAYAEALPIAGVPTLRALAAVVEDEPVVLTCLDARKSEVYLAGYARHGELLDEVLPVAALSPERAVDEIVSRFRGGRRIVVGDAPERYPNAFQRLPEVGIEVLPFSRVHPRGGVVAFAGEGLIRNFGGSRAEELVPFYVRPSAPEIRLREAH